MLSAVCGVFRCLFFLVHCRGFLPCGQVVCRTPYKQLYCARGVTEPTIIPGCHCQCPSSRARKLKPRLSALLNQSFPIVYRDESRHCSVALQGSSAAWLISRSHRLARHR